MSSETYEDIVGRTLSYWWGEGEDPIKKHLTFIGEVDLSEPDYSFNLLRFYVRKRDGVILYGTDSGCSCPSPFEDVTAGELKETDLKGVTKVARVAYADKYGSRPIEDVVEAARALKPAMREAGAR